MAKKFILIFLLAGYIWSVRGQEDFSSPLPIVLIETDVDPATGQPMTIPDEPKIGATMKIIFVNDNTVNHLSDKDNPDCLNYNGRIGIERRGHTSQMAEKKPYGLETRRENGANNNVSLLGMPKENDWVLNAFFYDDSYLRDCLTFVLGRRTGHYAPRTHYCELFLNGTYQGLYMLGEKIKIDRNRVNITKVSTSDSTEPAVTGGYIFQADRSSSSEPAAWTTESFRDTSHIVAYIFHAPKASEVTQPQIDYMRNYFFRFMQAVEDGDTSDATGYPSLIDVDSFIDFMLVGELASNVDLYQLSTFFHKNRRGKLCAGPLWDFNFAYGNDYADRSQYDRWQFDNGSNNGSPFWYQLFNSPYFHRRLANRWHELTSDDGPLSFHNTMLIMDSIIQHISPAIEREKSRWNRNYNYSEHIEQMRLWLQNRHLWMNHQLRAGYTSNGTLTLGPNPTTRYIEITGNTAEMESVKIYDLQGQCMLTMEFNGVLPLIDLYSLPRGIYIALIATHQETVVKKVVKL